MRTACVRRRSARPYQIADRDGARRLRREEYAEPGQAVPAAVFRERADRLLAVCEGHRIDQGHRAAVAYLRDPEAHAAELHEGPVVFGEGLAAVDHDVGPEPQHV